ncbi:MAG: hypothetical protein ABEL97_08105 [Salinibacter sp.]
MVSYLPTVSPSRVALGCLLLAAAVGTSPALGQAFGRVEETKSNVAYFYHARPGEATVQISVWGTVPRPGIYEIPDTTDLDKLLTMAGGAPLEPRTEGQKDATITVQVYRPEQEGRSQIFEAPLERMLQGDVSYPALRDNDIVVVETVQPKQPFGWRDVLSVASALGSVTLLAIRVFAQV